MSTNKRIDELDVLKGIGIILMMLDHCFAWGEKVFLHALIQSFHMPLFFIVSGYLWQNKDKTTNFIRHKVNTILVPHFNFAIIYSLVLTLNTNWVLWSIVLYALRRKYWTNRIFREMRR